MNTLDILDTAMAGYLRLHDLVNSDHVQEASFKPSRHPVPREDVNIRSKGMTSDPVWHVFADHTRQELSTSAKRGAQVLALASKAMNQAEQTLSKALADLEQEAGSHMFDSKAPESRP